MTNDAIAYVSPSTLNSRVEFDSAFTVREGDDSHIYDAPGVYAPTVYDEVIDSSDWAFFSYGYTGAYAGATSPVMHDSEFLGGNLARDILETPGVYVMVVCYWTPDDDFTEDDDTEDIAEGWAVLRRVD